MNKYSKLGISMWVVMLSNQPPFSNLQGMEAVKFAAEELRRPLLPAQLNPSLNFLVTSSWADNPSERPSFSEVLEKLRELFPVLTGKTYEQDLHLSAKHGAGCCAVM